MQRLSRANLGKVRNQVTYSRHNVGSDLCPPPLQGATCLDPLSANPNTMADGLAGTLLHRDMSAHFRPCSDSQPAPKPPLRTAIGDIPMTGLRAALAGQWRPTW